MTVTIYFKVCVFLAAVLSLADGCTEQCLFHYDVTFNEFQNRCGQETNGRVTIRDNKAAFSGLGYISLPVFERNTLQPYFAVAFKFRYTGKRTGSKQAIAILSNGCGITKPTVELSLVGNSIRLRLLLTIDEVKSEEVTLMVPSVDATKEVLIKIGQSSNKIQIKVGNQPIHVIEKSSDEHISSTECSLQIGSGYGLVPLVGEIDEFVFYPCINEGFFEKALFP